MTSETYNQFVKYIQTIDFDAKTYIPLTEAFSYVMKHELSTVLNDHFNKDLIPFGIKLTDKSKDLWIGIKQAYSYSKNLIDLTKKSGPKASFSEIKNDSIILGNKIKSKGIESVEFVMQTAPKIYPASKAFIVKIKTDYDSLEKPSDKTKYIIWLTIHTAALLVGLNAGNEFPDSDFVLWGRGGHRSFITHSVFGPLVVSFAGALMVRFLDRVENRLIDNPECLEVCRNLKIGLGALVIGFNSGVATHLIVDGLIQTGGTIRFHSLGLENASMIAGTKIDDMAYCTLMAYFSAILSNQDLANPKTTAE